MGVPQTLEFFVDPGRCIGCQSCIQACTECDTHKGQSMIQLDYVDRGRSTQTLPVVCMHCDSPTCAEVCPADAIKRTEDGVVQTARKARAYLRHYTARAATREEIARLRPTATPINTFQFGGQTIRTKVNVMVPRSMADARLDVTATMFDPSIGHEMMDDVFAELREGGKP